ncbi:PAS domain S-box protein [Streptomyces sp. NPDC005134]|uniref:PAS domain S-box protein n=1 Tax=unclassified Streptomyces TaxID=2593676 RepID=UPI0033AEC432
MAFETAGAAIALLDSKGTVVGWSQAARRLVGYWAAEGVGQCGGVLLVAADDEAKASQAAVQSALWGRWSDHAQVRHRDGHSIDVRLCESALSGQDARARWVVRATDKAALPRGRPRAREWSRSRASCRCRAACRSASSYATRNCAASG